MANQNPRSIYTNLSARSWTSNQQTSSDASQFHYRLPGFQPTRLVSLSTVAQELGLKAVYLKDETLRWGLPSFKILGASWATNRAIVQALRLSDNVGLDDLGAAAREAGIALYTATDGNHGRAVAKMARVLGLPAMIYVPEIMDAPTKAFITNEGATLVVVRGDYDAAVKAAADASQHHTPKAKGILIQDTGFEGYEEIPSWIISGYATMLQEIDTELDPTTPKLYIVPVGVGSLAQAVVSYAKQAPGHQNRILAVEPHSAACLWTSLREGESTTIETGSTIMYGMNCGTVSSTAWPVLKAGIDASVTVSDPEAHAAVGYLESVGVRAGPCGAATLAALRVVAGLGKEVGTVVLICSEGKRGYEIPGTDS
jgi:diaminopropionate ammonia-lyase